MTRQNNRNKSFEEILIVDQSHLDELNHVNNVVYLSWVNEVAQKHWLELSNEDVRQKYIWVALRHEIDYLKSSYLNDSLIIKTWVGESGAVKSIRHTEIYKDDTVIVKAISTWCLLDSKSLKPTRIANDVLKVLY